MLNKELIVRNANADGFVPKLFPGECCQDHVNNLWHFCAPDGSMFATWFRPGKLPWASFGRQGLEIQPKGPPHASKKGSGVVANRWTVKNGEWLEVEVV